MVVKKLVATYARMWPRELFNCKNGPVAHSSLLLA